MEKAIIQARQKETIRKQQTVLRTDSEINIDYFKSKQRGPNKYKGAPKDKGKESVTVPPLKKCDHCLGNNHPRKDSPAKDAICHACEKRGHYMGGGGDSLIKVGTDVWAWTLGFQGSIFAWTLGFGR